MQRDTQQETYPEMHPETQQEMHPETQQETNPEMAPETNGMCSASLSTNGLILILIVGVLLQAAAPSIKDLWRVQTTATTTTRTTIKEKKRGHKATDNGQQTRLSQAQARTAIQRTSTAHGS
jgi:hypothetical protein